jgi:hypothetical protein
MSENRLHRVLRAVVRDLSSGSCPFAIVGGFAVSSRVEPRFTRDLDLAVTVSGDREAEELVKLLQQTRGYQIDALVEQEAVGRLATVRLVPPGKSGVIVDLLFASSGIEPEIVESSEALEVLEGLIAKVATVGHLIATKVLSRDDDRRPQDRVDLVGLLKAASQEDLHQAREALKLIRSRGFHRGKDLMAELEALLPR